MAELLTRYAHLSRGGVIRVGGLAGTAVPHGFVPDSHTSTSCTACYGWVDDARHLTAPSVERVGAAR